MVINWTNICISSIVRSSWENNEVGHVVTAFKAFLIFSMIKLTAFNLDNTGAEQRARQDRQQSFDTRFLVILLKTGAPPVTPTLKLLQSVLCLTIKHTSESAFCHRSFKCRIQLSSEHKVDCAGDMSSRDSAKGKLWFVLQKRQW